MELLDDINHGENKAGTKEREWELFVEERSNYYIQTFQKLSNGEKMSFNIAAAIGNFLWYFYRQMYLGGLIQVIISLTLLIGFGDMNRTFIPLVLLVLFLFNGLLGNRFYFNFVEKKLTQVKDANFGRNKREEGIKQLGGVNPLGFLIVGIVMSFFLILVLVASTF